MSQMEEHDGSCSVQVLVHDGVHNEFKATLADSGQSKQHSSAITAAEWWHTAARGTARDSVKQCGGGSSTDKEAAEVPARSNSSSQQQLGS